MFSYKEQPTFNSSLSRLIDNIYRECSQKMITENYVNILVPFYQVLNYGIFGSFSWHSMLYLLHLIMLFYIYNKKQENIDENYVSIYGIFHQFSHYSLQ